MRRNGWERWAISEQNAADELDHSVKTLNRLYEYQRVGGAHGNHSTLASRITYLEARVLECLAVLEQELKKSAA